MAGRGSEGMKTQSFSVEKFRKSSGEKKKAYFWSNKSSLNKLKALMCNAKSCTEVPKP
jgi:hypothetical protein